MRRVWLGVYVCLATPTVQMATCTNHQPELHVLESKTLGGWKRSKACGHTSYALGSIGAFSLSPVALRAQVFARAAQYSASRTLRGLS